MACSSIDLIRKLNIPTARAGESNKISDSGMDKLFRVTNRMKRGRVKRNKRASNTVASPYSTMVRKVRHCSPASWAGRISSEPLVARFARVPNERQMMMTDGMLKPVTSPTVINPATA